MPTTRSEAASTAPEVIRMNIRVPPLLPEQPAVWFNQIEAEFVINGITDDQTKFYFVMARLEPKYAVEVQDIFDNPPATDKYKTLRKEVLHRISASQSQRIRQLLEHEELGDRTPSQFLRHMRTLARDTVGDEFLRTLWASRLPDMTRAIVTAQPDLELSKLAEIADQIFESSRPRTQVAALSQDRINDALLNRLESMEIRIAELAKARPRENSRRGYRRTASGSRGRRRSLSPAEKEHCWYHRTFGSESTKCRAPCNYKSGNE
ncbi:uncharacterized protein LOC143213489 [Lasioglossum baleicum]|uniref:uncharacterized protein LOC143213489 n=1 Tax=Lasioglossum baleicum TaxID=434251 RepID=UPI003FCCF71D